MALLTVILGFVLKVGQMTEEPTMVTYDNRTNKIILWGQTVFGVVPCWAWDSWDEVHTFLDKLEELEEAVKTYSERNIPEGIVRSFDD